MKYQEYLYLQSTDSLTFYPSNSPGKFYTKLPQCLELQGMWECCLLQMQYVNSYFAGAHIPKCLYVCSQIVTESIVNERKIPILRRIHNVTTENLLNQTIEADIKNLIYIPIVGERIDVINIYIYILDESSNPVTFRTCACYASH